MPPINGHLGDAYWAAGRKLEARYQWRRALTLNPEPDDAAKLEAKLHERRPSQPAQSVSGTVAAGAGRSARDRAFAPAKVNLYLHVVGRRADGYHLLDSLVVFAGVGDALRAAPAETLSLTVDGPVRRRRWRGAGQPGAARGPALGRRRPGLRRARGCVLEKHLPVASGIGGGSADAAAALRLLGRLWRRRRRTRGAGALARARRRRAGLPRGRPARMGGIGERLDAGAALPQCGMVLVNPGVARRAPPRCSARARRRGFRAGALPDGWADAAAMAARSGGAAATTWSRRRSALCPAIGEVLAALAAVPGCLLARMSGSGATCFGLFADRRSGRGARRRTAAAGLVVLGRRGCVARLSRLYAAAVRDLYEPARMGRRQAVRQRILIPPCGGSNPPAPARSSVR